MTSKHRCCHRSPAIKHSHGSVSKSLELQGQQNVVLGTTTVAHSSIFTHNVHCPSYWDLRTMLYMVIAFTTTATPGYHAWGWMSASRVSATIKWWIWVLQASKQAINCRIITSQPPQSSGHWVPVPFALTTGAFSSRVLPRAAHTFPKKEATLSASSATLGMLLTRGMAFVESKAPTAKSHPACDWATALA